jgi:hypothetical protein
MRKHRILAFAAGVLLAGLVTAQGAFILEIDTDGADDGVLTYNAAFAFGGDTTTASQSATSLAFGTTGGDSIYGGNGAASPDTYVYVHSPDSQADNLVVRVGQDLGDGNFGSGMVGGSPGRYAVYASWPITTNVSGGLVQYEVITAGDSFTVQIDQNGKGDTWVKLGEINYVSDTIRVAQTAGSNTFVSMRAYGLLFEMVPEPASLSLAALGGLILIRRRR